MKLGGSFPLIKQSPDFFPIDFNPLAFNGDKLVLLSYDSLYICLAEHFAINGKSDIELHQAIEADEALSFFFSDSYGGLNSGRTAALPPIRHFNDNTTV